MLIDLILFSWFRRFRCSINKIHPIQVVVVVVIVIVLFEIDDLN